MQLFNAGGYEGPKRYAISNHPGCQDMATKYG